MIHHVSRLTALCVALTTVGVSAQGPSPWTLPEARLALDALQVERAAPVLESLSRAHPTDGEVAFELGRLRLHQGRYGDAVEALTRSVAQASPRQARARSQLLELARATRDQTASFAEARSNDGRYVVRFPQGESALLAPYALETLRLADEALSQELGGHAPRPLRLEIYASPRDLARVSPLTVEQIETSGTIALSKWDRLMLTSPRALLRGYGWRDTIAHELAHLLLARASRNQAPVWLQEGIAKLLETTWRQPLPESPLDPASRTLLHEAVAQDELIPFSQLHPSIALLPSQRSTALAFAEVTSFMAMVRTRSGAGALRRIAQALARGADAQDATASVANANFAQLEEIWKRELRTARAAAGSPFRPLRFRHHQGDEGGDEVGDERARRRVRLGDLLSEAGHAAAASVEYEAAAAAAPDDPAISWRLARARLASGRAPRAVVLLSAMRDRSPSYEPVRAWLAQALQAQGDNHGASVEARAALGLNPFDPLPHCVLAVSATSASEREREGDVCRQLR